MPSHCSGSHILGRLQKLSYLQKISAVSKSTVAAYNDHVQNNADGLESMDSFPFYCTVPGEHWSAPSLRPHSSDLKSAIGSFPLQRDILDCTQTAPTLRARRVHTAATMKSSPAFLKTQQLFDDDRKFALSQVHASSSHIISAAPRQLHKHSVDARDAADGRQQHPPHSSASSLVTTHSDSSANSMADSVSSYHGYAGVNYQSSVKDIDAVPNQWGYSLNDYKAVFGDKYVHGCIPWEDTHVSKQDHKKFEKLHARRVQLLQELHGIERGIRELMK